LIGDPSGRTTERTTALSNDTVVENSKNIEEIIKKIFKNHETYLWPKGPTRKTQDNQDVKLAQPMYSNRKNSVAGHRSLIE
jgi:hypothetical protein